MQEELFSYICRMVDSILENAGILHHFFRALLVQERHWRTGVSSAQGHHDSGAGALALWWTEGQGLVTWETVKSLNKRKHSVNYKERTLSKKDNLVPDYIKRSVGVKRSFLFVQDVSLFHPKFYRIDEKLRANWIFKRTWSLEKLLLIRVLNYSLPRLSRSR